MRKTLLRTTWMIVLLVVAACGQASTSSSGVTYSMHWINKTRVHVIWINLNDKTLCVTPALAKGTIGGRQSFVSFIAQHQPLAQITGSYFSLKDYHPIGDIVIGGKKRFHGPVGTALAITPDNKAEMMNIPYNWKSSWTGYESVVKGGVRLVQNGKYAVYPRQQGFRDPGLFRAATRTAVGIDGKGRLLMVGVNKQILLSDLAGIMKALGCLEAMTLDGGTSTGLAYGSDVILMPGRTLSNVLMVVRRPEKPAPVAASVGPSPIIVDTPAASTPPEAASTNPPAADTSGPSAVLAPARNQPVATRNNFIMPAFPSVREMLGYVLRSLRFQA